MWLKKEVHLRTKMVMVVHLCLKLDANHGHEDAIHSLVYDDEIGSPLHGNVLEPTLTSCDHVG